MSLMAKSVFLSTVSLCVLSAASPVLAGDSLEAAFKDGKTSIDARYRYEFVDQTGIANEAHAQTMRTRLGYKTGMFYGFSAMIQGENITQIGPDNYNDTLNGRSDHPVVADVEDTAVNEAYLAYAGIPDTNIKIGRQIITNDGHRFVGHVGWRQNDQTFDAATVVNNSLPDTTLTYNYLAGVNRIFGTDSVNGDWESDSHAIHINNTSTPLGKLSAYGYLLDFETSSPANSSDTYGVSVTGAQNLNDAIKLKYHAEYARQSDGGSNTTSYDADYFHVAPALAYKGFTATVGYESLGSDNGTASFRTPLATLHKFNGWADKFLTTPANGLEDAYIDLTYKFGAEGTFGGLLLKGQYHDFSADNGGADYGTEFGFYAKQPIAKNYYVEAKYADYQADTFATDTQKFVFGAGLSF